MMKSICMLTALAAATAFAAVPCDYPAGGWSACVVKPVAKRGPRVCDAKGAPLLWFETRHGYGPAEAAGKVRARVTPDGLAFDLRDAFAAGARYVRLRTAALPSADFLNRDLAAVVEMTGPTGTCAQVTVLPQGVYEKGGYWLNRAGAQFVLPRRYAYSHATVVPNALKEFYVCIDFTLPGTGEIVLHNLKLGRFSALPDRRIARGTPKVLFTATFDDGFDGETAAGRVKPLRNVCVTREPGRHGMAARFRREKGGEKPFLSYAAAQAVDPRHGTVTFWMRRALRDTPSGPRRPLFELLSDGPSDPGTGCLALDLVYRWPLWRRNDYGETKHREKALAPVKPDTVWEFVSFSWDERESHFLLNGDTVPPGRFSDSQTPFRRMMGATATLAFADGFADRINAFSIGSGRGRFFEGLIDDVRIWSEALTGDEVRALYRKEVGFKPASALWDEPDEPGETKPNVARLPEATGEGIPQNMTLLEEVRPADLARANATNRFRSTGTWRIGTLGGEEYLEAGDGNNDRFAVRFPLPREKVLLCFEVTYPDDRARSIDVTVAPETEPWASYACQAGIECGREHPLTGRMAVKRFLNWSWPRGGPRGGNLTLVAMTRMKGESAAIAKIRVYEVKDAKLPASRPAAIRARDHRTVAMRYEDPAIGSDFGSRPVDRERERVTMDRALAYMAYAGLDTFVYPAAWYAGLIGTRYQPRIHHAHYLREYARRLGRDGMSFIPSINQQWLPEIADPVAPAAFSDGSLHASPIAIQSTGYPNPGGWHYTPCTYNIAHPKVQEILLREILAIADECADLPAFKGVCLDLFNQINVGWWGTLDVGYNDYAIAAFEQAKKVKVRDGGGDDPLRGKSYYAKITSDPDLLAKWIDWRCDVVTDFYRRIAAALAAKRSDLKFYVYASPLWRPAKAVFPRADLRAADLTDRMLREAGIDGAKLGTIPNLALSVQSISGFWGDELHGMIAPRADLEYVRDLPEAPGFYASARRTRRGGALFHDSYYETPVGSGARGARGGDGRLNGDWLQECPWRVTHFNASGREALRPFAKALDHGDLLDFAKGGFLVGTNGMEAELAGWARVFTALPAVWFRDVPGMWPAGVRVRTATAEGRRWTYAVNTRFEPVRVRLGLGEGVRDIATGAKAPREITLAAYEIRAFAGE